MITGYGRGWQEPLAVGRWARFKQRMREPMTKDDLYIAAVFIVLGTFAMSAIVYLLLGS